MAQPILPVASSAVGAQKDPVTEEIEQLDKSIITPVGHGASRRPPPNPTESGRALNRRVEITVTDRLGGGALK
jgi:flagellar motor protein MotB